MLRETGRALHAIRPTSLEVGMSIAEGPRIRRMNSAGEESVMGTRNRIGQKMREMRLPGMIFDKDHLTLMEAQREEGTADRRVLGKLELFSQLPTVDQVKVRMGERVVRYDVGGTHSVNDIPHQVKSE